MCTMFVDDGDNDDGMVDFVAGAGACGSSQFTYDPERK